MVTAEDKHKNKLEKKAYFGHYSNVGTPRLQMKNETIQESFQTNL